MRTRRVHEAASSGGTFQRWEPSAGWMMHSKAVSGTVHMHHFHLLFVFFFMFLYVFLCFAGFRSQFNFPCVFSFYPNH